MAGVGVEMVKETRAPQSGQWIWRAIDEPEAQRSGSGSPPLLVCGGRVEGLVSTRDMFG